MDLFQMHYTNQKKEDFKSYSLSFHFYNIWEEARQTIGKENRFGVWQWLEVVGEADDKEARRNFSGR